MKKTTVNEALGPYNRKDRLPDEYYPWVIIWQLRTSLSRPLTVWLPFEFERGRKSWKPQFAKLRGKVYWHIPWVLWDRQVRILKLAERLVKVFKGSLYTKDGQPRCDRNGQALVGRTIRLLEQEMPIPQSNIWPQDFQYRPKNKD